MNITTTTVSKVGKLYWVYIGVILNSLFIIKSFHTIIQNFFIVVIKKFHKDWNLSNFCDVLRQNPMFPSLRATSFSWINYICSCSAVAFPLSMFLIQ